jgi:hypothetical protein
MYFISIYISHLPDFQRTKMDRAGFAFDPYFNAGSRLHRLERCFLPAAVDSTKMLIMIFRLISDRTEPAGPNHRI